ncbi:MAG: hypothetical protein AAF640_13525 [Pseudomonadota bacterium]
MAAVVRAAETPPNCGPAPAGRTLAHVSGEVSRGEQFNTTLAQGVSLTLEPADAGWQLRVRDASGLDLSAMTPPRFGANPRDLFGWHFRDAANAGPNDGSVNAPQRLRLFEFEPALSGTAGIKAAPSALPSPGSGRGWLFIHGLGLDAFPDPQDRRARAVWIRFEACLTWPEDAVVSFVNATKFDTEEREQLYACGLPTSWRPRAWLLPRWLGGDFDDDGALDYAAPVEHNDGTRAVAVCLAGTWLHFVGPGGVALGDSTAVRSIEAWRVEETGRGSPDELRLLRHEKSAHTVWAEDRQLRVRTIYRLVTQEPPSS